MRVQTTQRLPNDHRDATPTPPAAQAGSVAVRVAELERDPADARSQADTAVGDLSRELDRGKARVTELADSCVNARGT